MVSGWVFDSNLRPFLECLSVDAGYDFDDDDWMAVHFGLLKGVPVDPGCEIEFEYPLIGPRQIELRMRYELGDCAVMFELRADAALEARAEAYATIASRYEIR
jgi:hypothetical protein